MKPVFFESHHSELFSWPKIGRVLHVGMGLFATVRFKEGCKVDSSARSCALRKKVNLPSLTTEETQRPMQRCLIAIVVFNIYVYIDLHRKSQKYILQMQFEVYIQVYLYLYIHVQIYIYIHIEVYNQLESIEYIISWNMTSLQSLQWRYNTSQHQPFDDINQSSFSPCKVFLGQSAFGSGPVRLRCFMSTVKQLPSDGSHFCWQLAKSLFWM